MSMLSNKPFALLDESGGIIFFILTLKKLSEHL